ncbi:MAG: dicarboxylate/amino acid:cation symporter [Bacteriovoracaceae bacterium]|nr:dicarboxylate/amino acid:cation symporter [Bacteriovoracaceae bacterium]
MTHGTSSKLTRNIMIGMVSGLVLGCLLNLMGSNEFVQNIVIGGVFELGGRIFMASLKVLVVPLVFVSIVCGTSSLDDIKRLGRIGSKTMGLYILTTALAIGVAILVAVIVSPGAGFTMTAPSTYSAAATPPLLDVIANIFPSNPFKAMVDAEMLQIIVFAVLFGVALSLSGAPGKRISAFFNDLNEIILKMVMMLIGFAPYGVFCLLSKTFALQGFAAILPLAKYFFVVLGVLFFHAIFVYGSMLKIMSGLSPLTFFKKYKEVPMFAFSTASSNATLPVNLEVVEKKLGVSNSIASFAIPLGATVNMDGTAIMQGVATVFVAQVYNIPLGFTEYLMVILTATLASIGTAGVPGVGLVMLAMVFRQVNLPVEGIGLIIGVDRLLDMVRTAVNVTGDAVVSCIVAKTEGQLDMKVFEADN